MRILIVKIGAIGDTIMATAMIPFIREKWPKADVTWVCGRTVSDMLALIPGIDHIVEINDRELLVGNLVERARALLGFWWSMLGKNYDLAVVGHSDPRYRTLLLPLRTKILRFFSRNSSERIWPVPGRYHAGEYVRLVSGEEGPIYGNARIAVLPGAVLPWACLPAEPDLDVRDPGPVIVIAPGGARNLLRNDDQRRWPLGHYQLFAQTMIDKGFRIAISGSAGDEWVLEAFSEMKVINWVGKLSLPELLAAYQKCCLLVTHDSGPFHLGQMAGIPVVGLFGSTNPADVSPHGQVKDVLVIRCGSEFACSPCYDGKKFADCTDIQCMRSITPDRVANECLQYLGGRILAVKPDPAEKPRKVLSAMR